jgi:hypothetical protein
MGLVTNDLSDWLSEPAPESEQESEENPFHAGAVPVVLARLQERWRNRVERLRRWFEAGLKT